MITSAPTQGRAAPILSPYKTAREMAAIARCSRSKLWRLRKSGVVVDGVIQASRRGHLLYDAPLVMRQLEAAGRVR